MADQWREGAPLHALTLWPEWAWAIIALDKRTENRSWPPPAWLIGQRFALHAGKHVGGRPGRNALDEGMEAVRTMAARAGWAFTFDGPDDWRLSKPGHPLQRSGTVNARLVQTSAIVATARLTGADRDTRTPWDVRGQWHWRLAGVDVLPKPIPCGGRQGLWRVPDDVAALVRRAA